jgi:DNA-binding CsgD family transcriptional regulator
MITKEDIFTHRVPLIRARPISPGQGRHFQSAESGSPRRSRAEEGTASGFPGSQSGIFILNGEGRISYLNHDAKIVLQALKARNGSSNSTTSPTIVYRLYAVFKRVIEANRKGMAEGKAPSLGRLHIQKRAAYLFRPFPLRPQGNEKERAAILVSVEKVSKDISIDEIFRSERLTAGEMAVVKLYMGGKGKKEIAASMNLSGDEVKRRIAQILQTFNLISDQHATEI